MGREVISGIDILNDSDEVFIAAATNVGVSLRNIVEGEELVFSFT